MTDFVVLIEYVVLSIVLYFAFGSEIQPSSAILSRARENCTDPYRKNDITFDEFLSKVLNFRDLFDNLYPKIRSMGSASSLLDSNVRKAVI